MNAWGLFWFLVLWLSFFLVDLLVDEGVHHGLKLIQGYFVSFGIDGDRLGSSFDFGSSDKVVHGAFVLVGKVAQGFHRRPWKSCLIAIDGIPGNAKFLCDIRLGQSHFHSHRSQSLSEYIHSVMPSFDFNLQCLELKSNKNHFRV